MCTRAEFGPCSLARRTTRTAELSSFLIADAPAQTGLPNRGVFLLSFQVDVPGVLARLADLGLGGVPRTMATPRGGLAATVVDPDGVLVELLPAGRGVLS